MSCEVQNAKKRKMSYLDKMIMDEDIPFEDLYSLDESSVNGGDFSNDEESKSKIVDMSFSPNNQEFSGEAYIEYRNRVIQQLALEYEREKKSKEDINTSTEENSSFDAPGKCFKSESTDIDRKVITFNHTLPHCGSHAVSKDFSYFETDISNDKTSKSETDLFKTKTTDFKPTMDWSSFEEQIKMIDKKTKSKRTNQKLGSENFNYIQASTRQWLDKRNEKEQIQREAIRKKLSLGHSEKRNDWDAVVSPRRVDRSYSSASQSLQICYVNDSCSSSDDDENSPFVSPSLSPMIPSEFSPRVYHCGRQASTQSSSLNSSPYGSESKIIRHNHHDHRKRSRVENLEMEARFQLAVAYNKAKDEVVLEKSVEQRNVSLVQKVLNGTLPNEVISKLKKCSLTARDCASMTVGQLRLIVNDMNTKKQLLSEDLVRLLLARDQLRTEQDAKLIDVEDLKAIVNALGPETLV